MTAFPTVRIAAVQADTGDPRCRGDDCEGSRPARAQSGSLVSSHSEQIRVPGAHIPRAQVGRDHRDTTGGADRRAFVIHRPSMRARRRHLPGGRLL